MTTDQARADREIIRQAAAADALAYTDGASTLAICTLSRQHRTKTYAVHDTNPTGRPEI